MRSTFSENHDSIQHAKAWRHLFLVMLTYLLFPVQKSSGFVYGVMALTDKTSLGFIVLALQENYPETQGWVDSLNRSILYFRISLDHTFFTVSRTFLTLEAIIYIVSVSDLVPNFFFQALWCTLCPVSQKRILGIPWNRGANRFLDCSLAVS